MLVVEVGDRLRIITQSDHAKLARDILALWKRDGLPQSELREPLLFATSEHDNGWREADSAPLLGRNSCQPYDFREMPDRERQRICRLGIDRHLESRPLEAFLILRHAERLYHDNAHDSDWQSFFSSLAERREALEQRLGDSNGPLERLCDLLQLADALSLGACGVDEGLHLNAMGYDASFSSGRIVLEPFPLAGASTLNVPYRSIMKRRFSGDSDLALELAAANWRLLEVSIVAAETA